MSRPQRARLLSIADELKELAQEVVNPVDNEAITRLGGLVDGLATDFGGRFPGSVVVLGTLRKEIPSE